MILITLFLALAFTGQISTPVGADTAKARPRPPAGSTTGPTTAAKRPAKPDAKPVGEPVLRRRAKPD